MTAPFQYQQYSWAQGPYDAGADPHRIYAPSEISSDLGWSNTFAFYNISAPPTLQNNTYFGNCQNPGKPLDPKGAASFPFSYPYGPIYPNPFAYTASVPGKVDLSFDRPFF